MINSLNSYNPVNNNTKTNISLRINDNFYDNSSNSDNIKASTNSFYQANNSKLNQLDLNLNHLNLNGLNIENKDLSTNA